MSEQRLQRLNEQLTSARKEAEASGGMGCQGLAMANQRCPCSYIGDHRRLWEGQCFQSFFLAIRSLLGCALTQGIQSLFIVVLASNDARRKMLAMLPIFQRSATETDPSCE